MVMRAPKALKGKAARCGQPQYWRDNHGRIRLMAIVDGWAVMRRPGCIPFVVNSKDLLNGKSGITPEAAHEQALLRDARRALDDFDRNGGTPLDEIEAEINLTN